MCSCRFYTGPAGLHTHTQDRHTARRPIQFIAYVVCMALSLGIRLRPQQPLCRLYPKVLKPGFVDGPSCKGKDRHPIRLATLQIKASRRLVRLSWPVVQVTTTPVSLRLSAGGLDLEYQSKSPQGRDAHADTGASDSACPSDWGYLIRSCSTHLRPCGRQPLLHVPLPRHIGARAES